MLNENEILAALAKMPLGGLRFFNTLGSTNDEALAWAAQGALDLSLVVADEQTAGRGRAGRKWFTPPGAALALSLILRPTAFEQAFPARMVGLGALALVDALQALGLQPAIKWPNDVLLNGRKVAGILVESVWSGNALDASVMGIGLNASTGSVPPPALLTFPATSLEGELGSPPSRTALLEAVLTALIRRRATLASDDFVQDWEDALAFRGQRVALTQDGTRELAGTLLGLDKVGNLRIQADEMPTIVHFGEIQLRPMDDKIG